MEQFWGTLPKERPKKFQSPSSEKDRKSEKTNLTNKPPHAMAVYLLPDILILKRHPALP